jgi:hypothetical protein
MTKTKTKKCIEEDDVKQALIEAYEAGWRGCLEMSNEYAVAALEKLRKVESEFDETWIGNVPPITINVDSRELILERNNEGVWESVVTAGSWDERDYNLNWSISSSPRDSAQYIC